MKTNKIVSLALFVIAALTAMTTPAYAVKLPPGHYGGSTEIYGECSLPEIAIQVDVPTDKGLYINPLDLPVEVGGEIQQGQIISEPAYIENKSPVPLSVNISATGTIRAGSNMAFSTASTKGSALATKRAFIYFEMKATDDPDNVSWDSSYNSAKHLVISAGTKSKKAAATLGAEGESGCYGAFRLTGDCIPKPKSPWTEDDGIDVRIVFTFAPMMKSAS